MGSAVDACVKRVHDLLAEAETNHKGAKNGKGKGGAPQWASKADASYSRLGKGEGKGGEKGKGDDKANKMKAIGSPPRHAPPPVPPHAQWPREEADTTRI